MEVSRQNPVLPHLRVGPCSGAPRNVDIRAIIGEQAYARLPEAVRKRFGTHGTGRRVTVYSGVMHTVAATWLGRAFAYLSRLVGSPVVAGTGHTIPCRVSLFLDPKLGGTVWRRDYCFPGRQATAATTKRLDDDGKPVESFNRWFGMCLDIQEHDGELHFVTDRYFAQLQTLRIYLPRFLSPGRLLVVHRDEGNGRFRFIMTLSHPLIGVLLHQDGVFHDPETEQ